MLFALEGIYIKTDRIFFFSPFFIIVFTENMIGIVIAPVTLYDFLCSIHVYSVCVVISSDVTVCEL